MQDALIFSECFEYDAYRTDMGDKVLTTGVLETFQENDIHFTATIEDGDVTIDWVGHGHFTGVLPEREEINEALITSGVPTPLDEEQYEAFQAAYNESAYQFFRNAWSEDDYDGVYRDEDYFYFMPDEPNFGYIRDRLDDDSPLTNQQQANLDVLFDVLPTVDAPDVNGTSMYVGRLVKEDDLPEYRLRALEIHLKGLIPIKEAQAHALREEGGEERVSEVFEDPESILASTDTYFERAKWMVDNAMPSEE